MNDPLRDEQVARNRESRERWQRYASHRRQVGTLLLRVASPGGRLLLLGAGNCNDVDLNQLLQRFAEIHLVDVDGEALQWGLRQQGLAGSEQIVMRSGLDLTGIAGHCARWRRGDPPSGTELRQAIDVAGAHGWPFVESPFDVAASIGLLSQLIHSIILSLPAEHPGLLDLVAAVRLRHLRLLMQAVRPGGGGMLVTEVVSSDSCPELTTVPASGLPDLLRRAIEAGNFFTGLNPAVLRSLWREAPELAPLTEKVLVARPWLWDFGPRVYACCAFGAIRRQPGPRREGSPRA